MLILALFSQKCKAHFSLVYLVEHKLRELLRQKEFHDFKNNTGGAWVSHFVKLQTLGLGSGRDRRIVR